MNLIHIVNGDDAAHALGQALALAAPRDRIVVFRDNLTVGPLRSIDDSHDSRAAFWQRVHGGKLCERAEPLDEANAMLRQLVGEHDQVVVWHSPVVSDQLLLRRVAFHLREVPQRVNEVALSTGPDTSEVALGARSPAEIVERLPQVSPISLLKLGRLAVQWQELKLSDCEVRCLRGNTFDSESFDHLDGRIVEALGEQWRSCAELASELGLDAADSVVAWRCRALAEQGQATLATDGSAARLPPPVISRT